MTTNLTASAWWSHALELMACGVKASQVLDAWLNDKVTQIPQAIQNSELVEMLSFIKQGKYPQAIHQTLTGREFLSVFKAAFNRLDVQGSNQVFLSEASQFSQSTAHKLSQIVHQAANPTSKLMEISMCGIAALLCFLQVNYAGLVLAAPTDDETNLATTMFEELTMGSSDWVEDKPHGEVISAQAKAHHAALRAKARATLAANGEDCYPCIHFPSLLVFARTALCSLPDILESSPTTSTDLKSILNEGMVLLWRLRAVNAHHRALIGNTETIRCAFLSILSRLSQAWHFPKLDPHSHPLKMNSVELTGLTETLENDPEVKFETSSIIAEAQTSIEAHSVSRETQWLHRYLSGCVALELNELASEFWFYGVSEQLLDVTSVVAGFVAKITGVLGRRTRYQKTSYSQLMLAGATQENMLTCPWDQSQNAKFYTISAGTYPYDIPLDDSDDILYHKIKLDNEADLMNAAKMAISQYCRIVGVKPSSESTIPEEVSYCGFALSLFSDLAQAAIVASAEFDHKSKPNFATATEQIIAQANAVIDQYRVFSENAIQPSNEAPNDDGCGDNKTCDDHSSTKTCCSKSKEDDEEAPSPTGLVDLPTPDVGLEDVIPNEPAVPTTDAPEPQKVQTFINAHFEKLPGARPFWGSYFSALTMRSLLECEESRRHLRALVQLETLISMYPATSLERLGTARSHLKAVDEFLKVKTAGADETNMAYIICKASHVPTPDEINLRMDGIFSSSITSWWLLKRTYAEMAQLKNMKQTALETYVEIGLWGHAIETYIALGRGAQAEKMIRDRLPRQGYLPDARVNPLVSEVKQATPSSAPTEGPVCPDDLPKPVGTSEGDIVTSLGSEVMEQTVFDRYHTETEVNKATSSSSSSDATKVGSGTAYFDVPEYRLWSFLGDLMDDPVYYLKSWDVSNNTFGYAQRQLGKYLLRHKKYAGAVRAFRAALEINNAQPKIWYACGVCYFELFELSQAIDCFSRCVALQPDNGEAWNNIAAAHLFLKNRRSAMAALEHATRLLFSSWKVWENYMYCALDLDEPAKALKALERLTALRDSTDKNTLLTIRYSPRQAKLQMLALAHITNAAEADATKLLSQYAKDQDRSAFVAINAQQARGVKLESPSILSQRLLSVIAMLEDTVAAMQAAESSMGGRQRGGGIEAGEANSMSAQVAVEQNQERERRRLKALSGIEEGYEDEEEDEKELEAGSEVKANEGESQESTTSDKSKRPILDKSYGSIAVQYHAFLHDCAARIFAANWAYQLAAERRERQANLIQTLRGWATHGPLVESVLQIVHEGVRMYKLAQLEARSNEDETLATKMASASRFFVQRVLSGLQLAERNGEVMKGPELVTLRKAVEELSSVLASLKGSTASTSDATATASSTTTKSRDAYDAYYGGGGYDDWR